MSKNLLNKYIWIIDTIHNAPMINFKDLNEKWKQNTELSGGEDLSKRTFNNWRDAISDLLGIDIENENEFEYRYYIGNREALNPKELSYWLYNTYSVSNTLQDNKSIKDRVLLEAIPSSNDYLKTILEAMKENKELEMTYNSYWREEENTFIVQPYCLKLFHQIWYLVATSEYVLNNEKVPRIYSLDRIKKLTTQKTKFKMPKNWDPEVFFKGCFGVIPDQNVKIERVKLKVSAGQANYFRSLPLHKSQKEIECNEIYSIFEYDLRPTYDFCQEILKNGEDVEVLEPLSLRKEIAEHIKRMANKYKKLK